MRVLMCLVVLMVSLAGCGGGNDAATTTTTPTSSVDGSVNDAPQETDSPDPTETPPADTSEVLVNVDTDGNTTVDSDALDNALETAALGDIDDQELAGLLLMREEEKLAGDVYRALFVVHGLKIFTQIADSEQTHTDAMKTLLDRYNIADPVGDNPAGIFSDTDLQMLYDSLVAQGTPTLMDALFVGATIEELDIADIERLKTQLVDNDDIALVYDNLLRGSRNHLRSFNGQIEANGWTYEPQYIDQSTYDAIVEGSIEGGR